MSRETAELQTDDSWDPVVGCLSPIAIHEAYDLQF